MEVCCKVTPVCTFRTRRESVMEGISHYQLWDENY